MKKTKTQLLTLCLGLSLSILGGCATGPETSTGQLATEVSRSPQAPDSTEKDFPAKPFAISSLYDLLVADMALNRGQFDTALPIYLEQARETRDIAIIELAARVADYMRDRNLATDESALEMALLWVEVEPKNPRAQQAAMQAYALQNNFLAALVYATWLYEQADDLETFLAITAIPQQPEDINSLIQAYQEAELSENKAAAKLLAKGILFRASDQLVESEAAARSYLRLRQDDQRGLLLLAQLLHQQGRETEALELIADALQRQPENSKLRLQYARFLTTSDRDLAIEQFEVLHTQQPDDQEVNFLLALLLRSQGKIERAVELFNQASTKPSLRADAQYHLGSIADKLGEPTVAIRHYAQVRYGRNYLAAVSRLSVLLAQKGGLDSARKYLQRLRAEQPNQAASLFQIESSLLMSANQPEQAMVILSDGLTAFPEDSQLLYARSMLAEQQDNFALAEQDLRTLISLDENNATALNALGYTMVLHTDRHQEAYGLIKRAYLLNPGDPATIDSMGWVLFQMGELQEALEYLEKAMGIMPDPEIAAHLGEVYWTLGNPEEALKSWRLGLEQAPGHQSIVETMQRLGASETEPTEVAGP
ncbi:MAG: tetratricopeptide repeat protein [Porticoccaceae bacterium]|nr:tetratricopeptide repeat protein [Porticoccaceae bacterium]